MPAIQSSSKLDVISAYTPRYLGRGGEGSVTSVSVVADHVAIAAVKKTWHKPPSASHPEFVAAQTLDNPHILHPITMDDHSIIYKRGVPFSIFFNAIQLGEELETLSGSENLSDQENLFNYNEIKTTFQQQELICGAITTERFDKLMIDLLRGLAYLHAQNKVHGDFKVQNCLIMPGDIGVLSDFGFTRALLDASEETDMPTITHVAPEMCRKETRASLTTAIDIYAFGITLFHLFALNASPYFPNKKTNPMQGLCHLVMGGKTRPDLADQVHPKIAKKIDPTGKWQRAMLDCLKLDPSERPTAQALIKRLQPECLIIAKAL